MIAAGRRCNDCWADCVANPYDDAAFATYDSAMEAYDKACKAAEPQRFAKSLADKGQFDAAYPKAFRRAFLQLQRGDVGALEMPVRFLENDPWVFGSGYVKADVIRLINRLSLPDEYAQRLRQVALMVIDKADSRREFRAYCRLARKVNSPALRKELETRLTNANPVVRRQAQWALEACRKPS